MVCYHQNLGLMAFGPTDLTYAEYILSTEELHLLKRDAPQVYEICWEVLCHFHIYAQVTGWRSRGVKQMSWANYLFSGQEEKMSLVSWLAANTDAEVTERISESVTSYVTELNEDTFKSDIIFNSFHNHAKISISYRALLAGFLMLWLKQCVVPTLPHKVLLLMYSIQPFSLFMVGLSTCSLLW